MAPPPPRLMDELIEEILLFFPADDPASLVRAALVCKSWRRIVSAPGFSRRFRELRHGAMLGVFVNLGSGDSGGIDIARFVPAASACPPPPLADRCMFRVLDSRPGRVLLHNTHVNMDFLVVWDPVTDEQQALPDLHLCRESQAWNAVVLCPSDTPGCRGSGPFLVVFVGVTYGVAHLCTYSSDSMAWSEPALLGSLFVNHGGVVGPAVLVEDVLHFTFGREILRYNVRAGHVLSTITSPFTNPANMCLVTVETGGLGARSWGLGVVKANGNNLSLWSYDGLAGWWKLKVIKLLDITEFRVLGYAESAHAVLVSADAGVFMVDLMTPKTRKVCDREGCIYSVVPLLGFLCSRSKQVQLVGDLLLFETYMVLEWAHELAGLVTSVIAVAADVEMPRMDEQTDAYNLKIALTLSTFELASNGVFFGEPNFSLTE